MGVTAENSGTQTAVIGTEHFVEDTNVAAVFTFHVDTVNMVAGDVLEVRIYQMLLTAGTARQVWFMAYYGPQPAHDVNKVSPPIGNELTDAQSLRFSIKQTFGTGRAFPWKVLKYS